MMGISPQYFEQMVPAYSSLLIRIGLCLCKDKHLVEDLVQDTFSSAWKSRELYCSDRGVMAVWLTRIMKRRIVDHWRKPNFPTTVVDQRILEKEYYDEDVFRNELSVPLQRALARLPECLRTTFLLVVVDNLTHKGAAEKLGVPLGTVLSRVSRAKGYLRKYLTFNKGEKP